MLVGLTSIFWVRALASVSSRRLAYFYGLVLGLFVIGFAVIIGFGEINSPAFTGLSTAFALFGILAWARLTVTGVIVATTINYD